MAEAKRSEAQQKLFEASGKVELAGKLTAFLYLLMRDHVQPGVVGDLMNELRLHTSGNFTNGWLARYAEHLAKELSGTVIDTVPCPFCAREEHYRYSREPGKFCAVCGDTKVIALKDIKPGFIKDRGCPNGCHRGYDPKMFTNPCHTCNDPAWEKQRAALP